MNKHLKKLVPHVDKHPRLAALLLSPVLIIGVPLTVFLVYPVRVLNEGLRNYREVWGGDATENMRGAVNAWSYCLIRGERGEW